MSIRNSDSIKQYLKDYLEGIVKQPINTEDDTLLKDAYVDPIAEELADVYTETETIQKGQTASYPSDVTDAVLEDLAYNWGLERKGERKATGYVVFTSFTRPTQTITIGAQDGTGSIVVSTSRQSDDSTVSFVTIQTAYLTTDTSQDSDGYYSVSAPIQCTRGGDIGNVASGSITTIESGAGGVDRVTNTIATSGGEDEEDNTSLAARILAKIRGQHKGIEDGMKSVAMSLEGVIDAEAVLPGDTEMTRYPYGGGTDLYILGDNPTPYEDTFTYASVTATLLNKKPVSSILSVSSTVGISNYTFAQTADYAFTQDTTTSTGYSAEAYDYLTWTASGVKPNSSATVTVKYLYDKNVVDTQDLLDAADSHFIGADVLVKQATKVTIDISATITKVAGANSVEVEDAVKTKITLLVNSKLLGEDIQKSDVIATIKDLDDVDNVSISSFKRRGGSEESNTISISKLEYARCDSASLSVSVS